MRVLIIEDDPVIAANLYDFLEGKGHGVDAAADGVTGLHLAVTGNFDAIVLDLGLPGMDGMTLCRKLRDEATSDTLRSHMHVLRRELAQAGGYDPVENVHGLGYRVVPRDAS